MDKIHASQICSLKKRKLKFSRSSSDFGYIVLAGSGLVAGPNWGGLAWCMFTFPTSVDEEAREKRV